MTWETYERDLDRKIEDLNTRVFELKTSRF